MDPSAGPLQDVAHVIQLAVAPVFLLTAAGTLLNVLSTRLARIVDRARVLVDRLPNLDTPRKEAAQHELGLLDARRKLVNMAITFATAAALFVCLLIAFAFTAAMLKLQGSLLVAILFVLAMFGFIGALVLFLREIVLAVSSTRMDPF